MRGGGTAAARHRRHREAEPFRCPRATRTRGGARAAGDGVRRRGRVRLRRGRGQPGRGLPARRPEGRLGVGRERLGRVRRTRHRGAGARPALYAAPRRAWLEEGRIAHARPSRRHDTAPGVGPGSGSPSAGSTPTPSASRPQRAPVPRASTVRQPERGETPQLARLDMVLPDHQPFRPVFSERSARRLPGARRRLGGGLRQPEVLERRGRARPCARGQRRWLRTRGVVEPRRTRPADHAAFLGFAAVLPEARGLGVGRALGEASRPGSAPWLRQHRHRLARDQPPVLTGLARTGLPRHLHAGAPAGRPLTQVVTAGGLRTSRAARTQPSRSSWAITR